MFMRVLLCIDMDMRRVVLCIDDKIITIFRFAIIDN